jgi:pilus assembly protein CpaC
LSQRRTIKGIGPVFLTVIIALLVFCVSGVFAQEQLLRVVKGMSIVVSYPEKTKTISIADQDIADVASVTTNDVVVIGKKEGTTSLIVWGESGKHTTYTIEVDRNTSGQQVVLEVQVAEVNRNDLSDYGFDFLWGSNRPEIIGTGEKTIGSFVGQSASSTGPDKVLNSTPGDVTTGIVKFLGLKDSISASIHALQTRGKIKLLANPRLVSMSGQPASFLVGGEIPVPIAQSSAAGGATTVTIEWKEYGVKLNFLPSIVDTNLVNLKITPEVSSLDPSNGITLNGFVIPALRTRRADATVEINSRQSLVLGGLMSSETNQTINRVPILGQIPILSFFFSRKESTKSENELLIIVSPRIITSVAQEIIPPLPTEKK